MKLLVRQMFELLSVLFFALLFILFAVPVTIDWLMGWAYGEEGYDNN